MLGYAPSASTTSATLHLRRGAHPGSFEELLGHTTIGIALDTYSHVLFDMQNHLTRALEDALSYRVAVRLAVDKVPSQFWTSFSPYRTSTFYLQTEEKAERVGFEPTRRLNTVYTISNRAPSANSDTSPGATDRSLPKSELAATPLQLLSWPLRCYFPLHRMQYEQ